MLCGRIWSGVHQSFELPFLRSLQLHWELYLLGVPASHRYSKLTEVSCLSPFLFSSLACSCSVLLSCSCSHALFLFLHVVCACTGGERELTFLVQLLRYLSLGPISEAQTLFIASVCVNFFGSLQRDFSLIYLVIEEKKKKLFAQPPGLFIWNLIQFKY